MLNVGRDDGWGVNTTGAAPVGTDRLILAPAADPALAGDSLCAGAT